MSDSLLSEMSRAAREHVLSDERWVGFARGSLEAEDRADLLARARAAGMDEEAIEAFGPRGEAFDDRLAKAALAAMKGTARKPSTKPASVTANDNAPTGRRTPAQVLPLVPQAAPGGQSRARFFAGAAVLAAAAAAALLVWSSGPEEMPAYTMLIEGGTQAQRSTSDDAGGVVKLAPGSRVVITMRPDKAAPEGVAARAYLFGGGRPSPELKVNAEVAESGAVRITATAGELLRGVAPGQWDLCVAVGKPDHLPAVSAAERPPARGAGFVTVCRQVEWAAP